MRSFMVGVLGLSLASCVSYVEPQRVPVDFSASDFNSISSSYQPRPTFAEISQLSNGGETLAIRVDIYGFRAEPGGISGYNSIIFERSEVAGYQSALAKFLDWSSTAVERGDMLSGREVARVSTIGGMDVRFAMHSGNQSNHYLVLDLCTFICTSEAAVTLDVEAVRGLASLLDDWQAGRIAAQNLDEVYN